MVPQPARIHCRYVVFYFFSKRKFPLFGSMYILLVSSCALYLVKPLSLTLSPSRCRNSSSAGPADSLLYISSSLLCPAMQYITPTFRWKLSYKESRVRIWCRSRARATMLAFLLTFQVLTKSRVALQ